MKYSTVFHLVSDVFRKAGVDTVLIGGFAVNHYKVTRQTIDIDFLCTKEDFDKIKAVELYYSWNSNAFSSDLGYSKIVIEDNAEPILITQNNINQYYIYKAFKNKVTVNKSKFANNL